MHLPLPLPTLKNCVYSVNADIKTSKTRNTSHTCFFILWHVWVICERKEKMEHLLMKETDGSFILGNLLMFNWQAKAWWIWLCNANEEICVCYTKSNQCFHLKSLSYMRTTRQWAEEEKIRLGASNSSNIIMKQTPYHIWKQRKVDTQLYMTHQWFTISTAY